MSSPHFPLRRQPLEPIFRQAHLLHLWKAKVRTFQKGQLLFDLYENLDFHAQRESATADICKSILDGSYKPTSTVRVSVEKSKGLCRHLSVPNCADALVLQALSDALYTSLKDSAPSSKSYFEKKETPFNNKNGNTDYGTLASWIKFQKNILNFSKLKPYIVVTDIANFYDFIGYRQLRNIISSICERDNEVILDTLLYCLGHLVWRAEYMPDPEMGLPQMDSDAPRILAHSFLYEADKFLDSNPRIEFARFMDDIDIGVNSISEAKSVLRDLDITLKARGVRLNSGKTHILRNTEAMRFFWVRENAVLDAALDAASNGATINRLLVRLAVERFKKEYRRHKYTYGNGEKVLKRYINLFSKVGIQLPRDIYEDLLKNRPGVRQNLFWHLSLFGLKRPILKFCATLLESGLWVDDASAYHFASYIVDCRYRNNKLTLKIILSIAYMLLESDSRSRFISGIWICSKYMDQDEILEVCRHYKNKWAPDGELGRVVGSLVTRFPDKKSASQFIFLIFQSHNKEAISAARFGRKIESDATLVNKLIQILKAENPSSPNRITHPKALLVSAARRNTGLSSGQIAQLKGHKFTDLDDAYGRH